jgi:aminotransferase
MMLNILENIGIPYFKPEGAYYVFCDISGLSYKTDMAFTKHLVKDIGVAVVPGSSFFSADSSLRDKYVRFCFSRKEETLLAAKDRLAKLKL